MRTDRYQTNTNKEDPSRTERGAAPAAATNTAPVRRRKNRTRLKLVVLLILLLLIANTALIVYSYQKAEDSLDISFAKDVSVEVGGKYSAMDYVARSVGDVTPDTDILDAESIGDKTMKYTVSKPLYGGLLNPSKVVYLGYSVVDTVKPVVLWSGDGTVLERGTDFDINKVIGYGDNADPNPQLKIKGKVNMKVNGDYPLNAKVTDASGNSTSWDLTVTVADSIPTYTDDSEGTQFGDFVSAHKAAKKADGAAAFGIDVSEWQGDIDFEAVKKAGCEFVFIRMGYSTNGEITLDEKFAQNLERARAAGLSVGVYMYSYDNTKDEARSSAERVVQELGGAELDMPVVFDWEDFAQFQTYGMSFTDLNRMYDAFADELASAGYECMLYGSKDYLEKVWDETDKRPIWLAHYTDNTDYKGPYRFWQASNTGRIKGIDGFVDMDVMY